MEMAMEMAESGNRVILWPQSASQTPLRCSAARCVMSECPRIPWMWSLIVPSRKAIVASTSRSSAPPAWC